MKEWKWLEKVKKLDKSQWLILVLAGILLFVIAIPVDKSQSKDAKPTLDKKTETTENATATYADTSNTKELEKELEEMLESMDGVGRAKVMITLKDDGESVVEKDRTDSNSRQDETDKDGGTRNQTELQSQETTVYTGSEKDTPFVSRELRPEVEGVLILADGADDPAVKQNISDAVLALFNVKAHKIKIVKMNLAEGAQ